MVRTTAFVAMAVGLVGVVAGWRLKEQQRPRCTWDLVPVVVAAVDVPAGTVLTFDMISQRSVPEQFVTSSVVKPDSANLVIGRVLSSELKAGDPLRWSDFPDGVSRGLAESRVAVPLSLPLGVSAGDHLDVLRDDGSKVAERARVLTASWVEVTAEEAASLARAAGRTTIVLRPIVAR